MKDKEAPVPSPAPSAEPPRESHPSANPPRLTPGMAALLRGNDANPKAEPKDQVKSSPDAKPALPPPATPRSRAVQISLIVADLLLLALAARLVLKAKGHLGLIEIALCIVALGLGAWLSCLALWRD